VAVNLKIYLADTEEELYKYLVDLAKSEVRCVLKWVDRCILTGIGWKRYFLILRIYVKGFSSLTE